MLTKKQYEEVLRTKDTIENAAKAVVDKVIELGLSVTTDLKQLNTEYKAILFSKLLAIDKGLTMRYNLTRSNEAKLNMIDQTISLDSYDDMDLLEELIKNTFPTSLNTLITILTLTLNPRIFWLSMMVQ